MVKAVRVQKIGLMVVMKSKKMRSNETVSTHLTVKKSYHYVKY